jgi:carboxyl-terminal processing protease
MLRSRPVLSRTIITILVLLVSFSGCFKKSSNLSAGDVQAIISMFLRTHVQYDTFDDELSSKTLDNLIKILDPGKYYFYQEDIDSFNKYRESIDDFTRDQQFEFLTHIFSVYNDRAHQVIDLSKDLTKKKYDFSRDETISTDRDKIPYAKTPEEMKERWRKNVKMQLLNYKNSTLSEEKAQKKLLKKFDLTLKRIDEIDSKKKFALFTNAFSTALDPHSNYLTQEEHEDFMISTNLKLEGIGVLLRSEDGFVTVERIIPGGAADKLPEELQLKPNDKIVSVAQDDEEPVDVIDMDLRDVVRLIRGEKGTLVKLTIIREMSESEKQVHRVIPIVREEIKLEDRAVRSEVYRPDGSKIKIGYMKLPYFYLDFDAYNMGDSDARSSTTDTLQQLNTMKKKGVDCIVLDLRGNPGGALAEAVKLAGLFIDKGPIVQIKDSDGNIEVMPDPIPGSFFDGPVVVLINKFSASASEIFAGAIKDYKRGLILGPTGTFGKGTVQSYNDLQGKRGAVKVTTALFYQPKGYSNQLQGIEPHITIPDMSQVWDIGEDQLRYPLVSKKIPESEYIQEKKYISDTIIRNLSNRSSKRISKNADFIELTKKIKEVREKMKSSEINLKEESSIEKEKQDFEEDIRKNESEKLIDLENDLFLKEAFTVTTDYLMLIK